MQTIVCDLCRDPIENKIVGAEGIEGGNPDALQAQVRGGPAWSVREPMTVLVNLGWDNNLRYDYHEDCYSAGLAQIAADWPKWKRAKVKAARDAKAAERVAEKPKKKSKGKIEVRPPKGKKRA